MTFLKNIIRIIVLSGVYLSAATAQNFQDSLTKAERDYLSEHPIIRAHNEINWPPFNFNVNGKAEGYSIDLMNILAKKIGVKVVYVSGYSWGDFLQMLPTNALDVMINVSITDERKKTMVFTHPFLHAKNAIYTNVKKQAYYTLDELRGKKVALVKDFFIQKYIQKHYPNIEQVLVPDLLSALQELSFEKVDAVVGKQVVVDYILRENLLSSVLATDYIKDPRTISHLAIAADKKDTTLIHILDKALRSLDPQVLERLKHKWLGINALLNTQELLSPEEKTYLKGKQRLQICYYEKRKPIEGEGETGPEGIAIDAVQTVGRRLNVNLAFVPTESRQDALEMLRTKHCDVMSSAIQIQDEEGNILFSRPYLRYSMVIVTRKGTQPIGSLREVKQKTCAIFEDNPLLTRLQTKYPNLHVLVEKNMRDALQAVQKGQADFTIVPKAIYESWSTRGNCQGLTVSGFAPMQENVCLAVSKRDPLLLGILNKVIQTTPREAYRAISDKWLRGTVIQKTDYTAVFQMLAVALLIIGGILLAYWKQQKLTRHIEELNASLEEKIATALKKNEEQRLMMLHQDRLARMGEMISMIAHQWRQPLNNLALSNQLLISKYIKGTLDDHAIEYFKESSQKQIRHMSETIDDFRSFNQTDKKKTTFCVQDIVKEMVERTRLLYESFGIIIYYQGETSAQFDGYPNELIHAIQNLMANARDALKEQATSPKEIFIRVYEDSEDIIISVRDNAGGIPEEIRDQIFEPYFSTKDEKNGTGLGLYMTNVIIRDHMASDIVVNHKSDGTEFMIILKRDRG